ncbi:MAG: hydroxymethylglutaryl-CoA synthase [Caldilineaceae bacterium]
MPVGIEKLNLYAGRCYLDLADVAQARGSNPAYYREQIMCQQRSVYPPYEDAVTLAVNAAQRLLTDEDRADIELLIVGTESAVDLGKPLSTWVHRFCDLPSTCRNFEVKHACYAATGALKMAAAWVAANVRPGKKALVINSDLSRNFVNTPHEPVGGGVAVAMLVSAEPHLLEIDLTQSGYWTYEIADTFRPTSRCEIMNGEISIYAYLDALDGAYTHYEELVGATDYRTAFRKHIYHAPFPGMTLQAHQSMLNRFAAVSKAAVQADFTQKVAESLTFAKRIGSAYGSSNFVCLLSLLTTATDLQAGDPISLFAYGSGCQGEFYRATLGQQAVARARAANVGAHLDARQRLTVAAYEANEQARETYVDCADYCPDRLLLNGVYAEQYAGQGLLVLNAVEHYARRYEWS